MWKGKGYLSLRTMLAQELSYVNQPVTWSGNHNNSNNQSNIIV